MSDPRTPGQPTPDPSTGPTGGGAAPADPTLAYEPPAYGPGQPAGPFAPVSPAAPAGPAFPPGQQYGTGQNGPAPSYGAAPQYAPSPLTDADRNWAMAAHLSGFVAAYVALGFLGPLVVMLTAGNRSPFVRRHAVEALNFNLTVLIAVVVSVVLMFVLVGFLTIVLVGLGYLVATIAGAVAASRGEEFRYPLTIRFVS